MTLDMLYVITRWWIAELHRFSTSYSFNKPRGPQDYSPTADQLIVFDAELRMRLLNAGWHVDLVSDSGPGEYLDGAAKAAGISDLAFPPYTVMLVRLESIVAAAGYSQPFKVLWTAQEGILSVPRALPADL